MMETLQTNYEYPIKCPKCGAGNLDIRINPGHIGQKFNVGLMCAKCDHRWIQTEMPETKDTPEQVGTNMFTYTKDQWEELEKLHKLYRGQYHLILVHLKPPSCKSSRPIETTIPVRDLGDALLVTPLLDKIASGETWGTEYRTPGGEMVV